MKKKYFWIIAVLFIILGGFLLYFFVPSFGGSTDSVLKENTKFQVKGDKIYMDGLINNETYDQFINLLEKNPQIKTIVEERIGPSTDSVLIDIIGGRIGPSMDDESLVKLSQYIKEKGLNTKLLSYSHINSAGLQLFLSGVERTMETGAHIGVHSWYLEDTIGQDDSYWFSINAVPSNGIYELSEKEIEKFKLLTKPIIRENLTKTEKLSGTFFNKIAATVIGNITSDTIIINVQGGPVTEFSSLMTFIFILASEIDFDKIGGISVHQEQSLKPWKFKKEEITFEQAKEYDKKSVERLVEVIKYFKNKGKKVYVVGGSFGAFVVQDSIAEYGNIADKYLIMVGRLNMEEEVWNEFKKGNNVGFEYDKKGNSKIVPFDAETMRLQGMDTIEGRNMARLASGLGYKRYMTLLKDTDLSNVIYVHGKTDKWVGKLSEEELDFLKVKKVKILEGKGDHSETVMSFYEEGIQLLLNE